MSVLLLGVPEHELVAHLPGVPDLELDGLSRLDCDVRWFRGACCPSAVTRWWCAKVGCRPRLPITVGPAAYSGRRLRARRCRPQRRKREAYQGPAEAEHGSAVGGWRSILSPVAIRVRMHRETPVFIAEPEVGWYATIHAKPNT